MTFKAVFFLIPALCFGFSSSWTGVDSDVHGDFTSLSGPETAVHETEAGAYGLHAVDAVESDYYGISDVAFLDGVDTGAFRKAPYILYRDNIDTGMTVIWQLDGTAECVISWGPDTTCSMGSDTTTEYGSDHQHAFTITGLSPATQYYFKVISASTYMRDVKRGTFRTAPTPSTTSLNFFAYGDTRSNPGTHNQVANAMLGVIAGDPDFQTFVCVSGDLVGNGDSESAWDDEFFDPSYAGIQAFLSTVAYQTTLGNHEGSGVLFKKYFPYHWVGGRYWSFDYGPAHVAVVDQYTPYGSGSAQLTWLQNDLSNSSKPWKFIVLHEPGWSAGGHGNNSQVQNYIQPLCTQYGVSIVFGGHNHYYARAVVDDVHHITTGGGGAPLYDPDPSYPNIVATAKQNHYCKIQITADSLYFEARSISGTLLDSFSIYPTSIESGGFQQIASLGLEISPNPVSGSATVNYSLTAGADVTVSIYDLQGRVVKNLYDASTIEGEHSLLFSTSDMMPGVYFVRLDTPSQSVVESMVVFE